ncbi:hypothetical protein M3J09_012972 [Ascochyta lentis]
MPRRQIEGTATRDVPEHRVFRELALLPTVLKCTKSLGPKWVYRNYSRLRRLSKSNRLLIEDTCKRCAPIYRGVMIKSSATSYHKLSTSNRELRQLQYHPPDL